MAGRGGGARRRGKNTAVAGSLHLVGGCSPWRGAAAAKGVSPPAKVFRSKGTTRWDPLLGGAAAASRPTDPPRTGARSATPAVAHSLSRAPHRPARQPPHRYSRAWSTPPPSDPSPLARPPPHPAACAPPLPPRRSGSTPRRRPSAGGRVGSPSPPLPSTTPQQVPPPPSPPPQLHTPRCPLLPPCIGSAARPPNPSTPPRRLSPLPTAQPSPPPPAASPLLSPSPSPFLARCCNALPPPPPPRSRHGSPHPR